MEVDLSPETLKRLNDRAVQSGQTVQEFVVSVLQEQIDEMTRIETMLDGRYDALKSGDVKPVLGDDVVSHFREKSAAARRLKPAA
jgi:hypothetical protein